MRILIHSNAPWVPTGYGVQARLLADQLSLNGHTVAFSAFSGLSGADIAWRSPSTPERPAGRKYLVMPSGQLAFGLDMLIPHAHRFQADAVITLMDTYKLLGQLGVQLGPALRQQGFPVLAWTPVDCYPLSNQDRSSLEVSGALPVAMSRFGESQLASALGGSGNVRYAPHAVDTVNEYYPMTDREVFRQEVGVDDKFVVGLCAANKDTMRKAFPEQFAAFATFHRKHRDSVLLVHSAMRCVSGIDLGQLADDMGIADAVMFSDQYAQDSGLFDTELMRRWYNALDVLMLCSYGEGFGVPLIEAQACGTPVITTNGSATAELVGPGFRVEGDPFWNFVHRAYWIRPRKTEIYKALVRASDLVGDRRERAREFAVNYDVSTVFDKYWMPILKEIDNVHTE